MLRRCLAKDPGDRLRDIADVRLGLLGAFDDPDRPAADAVPAPGPGPGRRRRAAEPAVAAVLAAMVAGLGVRSLPPPEPSVPAPVRFTIPASPNVGPISARLRLRALAAASRASTISSGRRAVI